MRTEDLSEEVLMDIGFQEEVFAECQPVAFYLLARHGQGGDELSQQPVYGVHRYLPNAEEAEDVVDAVGIEVFCHFVETFHPPGITVFFHDIPVIGGEAQFCPFTEKSSGGAPACPFRLK